MWAIDRLTSPNIGSLAIVQQGNSIIIKSKISKQKNNNRIKSQKQQ